MSAVPWLWICWSIEARAPEPSAIMAITDATPMITPSIVSAERTLLRRIARSATRRVSWMSIAPPSGLGFDGRQRQQLRRRVASALDRLVAHDAPVAARDHAGGVAGDVVLVG